MPCAAWAHPDLGSGTPRGTYGRLPPACTNWDATRGRHLPGIEGGLPGDDRNLLAIAPRTEQQLLAKGAQQKPVVSIVCTTYNHERYIESAIRGFLSQDCSFLRDPDPSTTLRPWTHAGSDPALGSNATPKLIKPILQTENQKSQGVRPFELLLAQARGDYVATCEGDDFWVDPAKLQKQVGYLMAHPEGLLGPQLLHFVESKLSVKVWNRNAQNLLLSPQQLMSSQCLLWLPTLVFRKTFSALPPERALAAFGDQFLTSFLGTQGPCAYFNSLIGAVRRENEFSSWSPLPEAEKERRTRQDLGHRRSRTSAWAMPKPWTL